MSSSMTEAKEGLGVSVGVEPSKSCLISFSEMVAACSALGGIREGMGWTHHFNQIILLRSGPGLGDPVGRRFTDSMSEPAGVMSRSISNLNTVRIAIASGTEIYTLVGHPALTGIFYGLAT